MVGWQGIVWTPANHHHGWRSEPVLVCWAVGAAGTALRLLPAYLLFTDEPDVAEVHGVAVILQEDGQ